MKTLRTVFMGSPAFAVPCLEVLAQHTHVLAVVCQPDKPAGRGLVLTPPATKTAAHRLGIPVLQPLFLRPHKSNFVQELKELAPDLVVVVAYGKILPPEVLSIPTWGCWNVHGSILPKYRGAAPIQWALIQGETCTGVTLMKMDAGMDTGPTFFTKEVNISPMDTTGSLYQSLSILGSHLLQEGILQLQNGSLPLPQAQAHPDATMAPLLTKEHGLVDFTRPAALVSGQVRGVDPWPGAYTTLSDGTVLKLFRPLEAEGHGAPGQVLGIDSQGHLRVACGQGAVAFAATQLPNRKRMLASSCWTHLPASLQTMLGDGLPNPRLLSH